MDYYNSYMTSVTLAKRVRESAAQGKQVKTGYGLASRDKAKASVGPADFGEIRAKYMTDIQDLFSGFSDLVKSREEAQKQPEGSLSYGLDSPVDKPSDYAVGRERNTQDLMSELIMAESSGNSKATYTTSDGRTFGGRLQIGEARLQDYNKANGVNISLSDMMGDTKLEDSVMNWHMQDLTQLAEKLSKKTNMSVPGLVAVGHLGGRTGMAKFAAGGYDPNDELGTNLSDYYSRFR